MQTLGRLEHGNASEPERLLHETTVFCQDSVRGAQVS